MRDPREALIDEMKFLPQSYRELAKKQLREESRVCENRRDFSWGDALESLVLFIALSPILFVIAVIVYLPALYVGLLYGKYAGVVAFIVESWILYKLATRGEKKKNEGNSKVQKVAE